MQHIVQFVQETLNATLHTDQAGEPWLRFDHEGQRYSLRLRHSGNASIIRLFYFRSTGVMPKERDVVQAFNHLAMIADLEGTPVQSGTRVVGNPDRVEIVLDKLTHEVLAVTRDQVAITHPEFCFVRTNAAGELPRPSCLEPSAEEIHSTLREFRQLTRLDEEQTRLVLGFLMGVITPFDAAPVLNVIGGEGSGKGLFCEAIRSIVDPFTPASTSLYGGMEAIRAAIQEQRVLSFDNVSPETFTARYSDLMCQLSTGMGFSGRTRTGEPISFQGTRAIIINGLVDVIGKGDLATRVITVQRRPITECQMLSRTEFECRFATLRPRLVTLLAHGLKHVLANYANSHVHTGSRMVHLMTVMASCEQFFGWEPGGFQRALDLNQREAKYERLSGVPIVLGIELLLPEPGQSLSESPRMLCKRLQEAAPDSLKRCKGWPQGETGVTRVLNNEAVALAAAGFEVEITRRHIGRNIAIVRREVTPNS